MPELEDREYEIVRVNPVGDISERETVRVPVFEESLGKGISISMVRIPTGAYAMGAPRLGPWPDEKPSHYVHIKSFFLSQLTITRAQWKAVTGGLFATRGKDPGNPVDRVSWFQARAFCVKLAKRSGRTYRLPSESEWEYACRAGSKGAFYFGDTITTDLANYVGWHKFGLGPKGEYRHGPIPGGHFPPNAFGLFDMHGNLAEWCADTWHENYESAPSDEEAWTHRGTDERVIRGGSWHDAPELCRSSARLKLDPKDGEDFVGFRVALSAGDFDRK